MTGGGKNQAKATAKATCPPLLRSGHDRPGPIGRDATRRARLLRARRTRASQRAFEADAGAMAAAPSSSSRRPARIKPKSAAADDGEEHLCLICLSNADDHEDRARGLDCGMCSACGTFNCCDCNCICACSCSALV